ncbi:MAG: hypothetical protein A2V79_05730 [Betaproteobacteria bacterium RBG_16_56_24]|nr:MAG: hypothetical protein A2V79_05730 [Betaproteobacteria bacterium RBG_16_56_24]
MKTTFSGNAQRKLGAILAGGAAMLLMSSFAMAAITGSRHDLSTTGAFNQFTPTAGNSEICVFCHTPHGSSTDAPVPLWNRTLHTTTPYLTYAALGTSSLDAATAPVGSVSLACLSCHDGTQAMNEIINSPGSGTGTGTWAGTFTAGSAAGAANTLAYGTIVNLTTDLRNDHPVGVQYGGGRGTSGFVSGTNYAAGSTTDTDFKAITAVTGKALWYIDTNGTAGRQNVDLPLYTRADTLDYLGVAIPGGANQPYVECASCHDPHNTANGTFLRYSNANSTLCLACHAK